MIKRSSQDTLCMTPTDISRYKDLTNIEDMQSTVRSEGNPLAECYTCARTRNGVVTFQLFEPYLFASEILKRDVLIHAYQPLKLASKNQKCHNSTQTEAGEQLVTANGAHQQLQKHQAHVITNLAYCAVHLGNSCHPLSTKPSSNVKVVI